VTAVRCARVADRRGVAPEAGELVVLVDGLWPRGVPKADLPGHEWAKDVAPSTELRQWFHAFDETERAAHYAEFAERYRAELAGEASGAVDELAERVWGHRAVTLLYAVRDTEHNHAQVLAEVLTERLSG